MKSHHTKGAIMTDKSEKQDDLQLMPSDLDVTLMAGHLLKSSLKYGSGMGGAGAAASPSPTLCTSVTDGNAPQSEMLRMSLRLAERFYFQTECPKRAAHLKLLIERMLDAEEDRIIQSLYDSAGADTQGGSHTPRATKNREGTTRSYLPEDV